MRCPRESCDRLAKALRWIRYADQHELFASFATDFLQRLWLYRRPEDYAESAGDTERLAQLGYASTVLVMAYEKLRQDLQREVMKAGKLDKSALMTAYVLLGGDASAVASLFDVPEADVQHLAEAGKWADLVARQRLTREKAINRALNFAVAHKLRSLLARFVDGLSAIESDELLQILLDAQLPGEVKRRLTFRDLQSLAATLRDVSLITSAALGDTPAAIRAGDPAAEGQGDSAAKAAALAGLFLSGLEKTVEAQVEESKSEAPFKLPEKPEDDSVLPPEVK